MLPIFEYVNAKEEMRDYSDYLLTVITCKYCNHGYGAYASVETYLGDLEKKVIVHQMLCKREKNED